MLNKTLFGVGTLLLTMLTSWPAAAQEGATLALRNGERPAGELMDLNASGFTMKINGQEQQFRADEVAAIEFEVFTPPAEAQSKVKAGQGVVLLKGGSMIEGRLTDIGGSHPLRLTFDTPSGSRDFKSSEIAMVLLHPLNSAATSAASAAAVSGTTSGPVAVQANQPWTPTGVAVRRGERLTFNASGDIMVSAAASSGPGGSPAATVQAVKYPIDSAPVGALIGRIGNGRPFVIGTSHDPVTMVANGQLFLGVNDDHFGDNTGNYTVTFNR